MGYHTGINSVAEDVRREILEEVYRIKIVPVQSSPAARNHVKVWGDLVSPRRLRKMKVCLLSLIKRNRQNNPVYYETAIEQWRNDLRLMMEEFGISRDYIYKWPDTTIRKIQ